MSADAESTTDAERLAAAGARARAGNLERGRAKLELGLAKGKKLYDKPEAMKEKDARREMRRRDY